MDVKNNPEKSSATKLENIFQKDFQCLTYFHLNTQKISMMYTEVKSA